MNFLKQFTSKGYVLSTLLDATVYGILVLSVKIAEWEANNVASTYTQSPMSQLRSKCNRRNGTLYFDTWPTTAQSGRKSTSDCQSILTSPVDKNHAEEHSRNSAGASECFLFRSAQIHVESRCDPVLTRLMTNVPNHTQIRVARVPSWRVKS